jgi:DNA-binding NarL/FixJ family response regulator
VTYLRTCVVCLETQELVQRPRSAVCRRCNGLDCHNIRSAKAQAEVDEVAVQRLLSGSRVSSTRAERQEAVKALLGHLSNRLIAQRLHVAQRTVERLRARISA